MFLTATDQRKPQAALWRLLTLIITVIGTIGLTAGSASALEPTSTLSSSGHSVVVEPETRVGVTTHFSEASSARISTVSPACVGKTHTGYDRIALASCVATKPGSGPRTGNPSEFTRTEALTGRGSARQVSEIADSMKVNGWNGPPIKVVEVNGKMYVVDGHHRLAAASQAGVKVQYEVVEPSTVIGPGQWSSVDDIVRDANSVGPNKIRTK